MATIVYEKKSKFHRLTVHPKFLLPHLSQEKNPALLSIESWLFNKDPYFMVYDIMPI